jgi:hypothetical protein
MTSRNYLKLLAILALISSTFCTNKRASPPRPAQVPLAAIWSGGAEGGAWYDCTVDRKDGINVCAVYSESDGKLSFKASYRLKNVNRAASAEELKDPVIDVLNGHCIYLADQKTLVPVEVLFNSEE